MASLHLVNKGQAVYWQGVVFRSKCVVLPFSICFVGFNGNYRHFWEKVWPPLCLTSDTTATTTAKNRKFASKTLLMQILTLFRFKGRLFVTLAHLVSSSQINLAYSPGVNTIKRQRRGAPQSPHCCERSTGNILQCRKYRKIQSLISVRWLCPRRNTPHRHSAISHMQWEKPQMISLKSTK